MTNILAIAYYELKKILRNHRLVLIVISQPIVIALIVGLITYQEPKNIKIGVVLKEVNTYSQAIANRLAENSDLDVKYFQSVEEGEIRAGRLRAFVSIDINANESPINGKVQILNDPTGGPLKFSVQKAVADAVSQTTKDIATENVKADFDSSLEGFRASSAAMNLQLPSLELNQSSVEGMTTDAADASPFDLKHFDYFASAMMVLLILLVVINLSSISITTERTSGTFERLFVTPYTKIDVIFGKALAQLVVGIFVFAVGLVSLYLMFHISIGSIWLTILIDFLVAATSVTLGLLVSSVTYTIVESIEVAMYIFFISVLCTGILSPLETAYKYFPYVMKIVPFYYAVDASRRVNMTNASWMDVSQDIYILIAFFLVFLVLSVLLLRREAK